MSNIDKHAVQAVADLKAGYTLGNADVAILNELARIALASLEAEAVGEVVLGEYDDCGCHPDAKVVCIAADGQADWENFKDGTRLYTAPPAPVSVPAAMEMDDDFDSAFEHGKAVGWNAYRAAMLQGAKPVTTAYKLPFEQWLSQQTGTIDVECGCVMTEVFFHWLRVAYEAANSSVIPDGVCPCCGRKPLKNRTCSVSGCDGKHVARGFCIKHYAIERKKDPSRRESIRAADKRYRARKAAAPQQEVTQALAKGMERYGDAMRELAKKEEK
ncbi:hypothetical protein [Enterobacter hormaechei]|uniref:hypothetical protein n=1 Tax=Enterobacter hormaechei TaxID=158836 RepID=UPI000A84BFD1|nr:hypothetical protein [Enterobacter hormaechei]